VGSPRRTGPALKKLTRRSKTCCRFQHRFQISKWSWRRDLNPRPSDYKSDALPAELRQPKDGFPCFAKPLRHPEIYPVIRAGTLLLRAYHGTVSKVSTPQTPQQTGRIRHEVQVDTAVILHLAYVPPGLISYSLLLELSNGTASKVSSVWIGSSSCDPRFRASSRPPKSSGGRSSNVGSGKACRSNQS
jgi:hypothetical protein